MSKLHLFSKKTGIVKTLSIISCYLLVQPAFANGSWYIDNATSQSGDGSAWNQALKRFAEIPWSKVNPGDTIYISGGPSGGSKKYTESWSVGADGAPNAPIVITVDKSNPAHNGTAVFDFDALGDHGGITAITVINHNYITFEGNVNGENHIAINNLRNINVREDATCLGGYGDTSIVVDHMDFNNCNNGVRLWGGSQGTGTEIMFSNFKDIRGDAAILLDMGGNTWDVHKVHDNTIELLNNDKSPNGGGHNIGPDGIQTGPGISFYNNRVKVTRTTKFTSDQHTDYIQHGQQSFLKIYNNEFINIGDSGIDIGVWSNNENIHDIYIYNNIFRIETKVDIYPQFIRLYANPGSVGSINNLKILNNVFMDSEPGWPAIVFNDYRGNPTASGVEIKNNIFFNNTDAISIDKSPNFTNKSFDFGANIYFPANSTISFDNHEYTATNWVGNLEPTGKTDQPSFVSYSKNSPNNDLHLKSTDTAAINAGISQKSYFTYDKDNVDRPVDGLWDIGPFEFHTGGTTNLLPPQNLQYN